MLAQEPAICKYLDKPPDMNIDTDQLEKIKDKNSSILSPSEKLRIVIAFILLLVGFGLAAYGWYFGNDHIYHLGLTLGPSGLVVLVFEYLVRISLDTRQVQKMIELDRERKREWGGIREETISRLEKTTEELLNRFERTANELATFDLDKGKLGLVGIYSSRADAVRFAISPMIEAEKEAIYIVGSTIFGLCCDAIDGPGQSALTPEDLIKRIAKRKEEIGCEVRILLTDPKRIFERHQQEAGVRNADRGTIASELRNVCTILTQKHLQDCTWLYDGSPTCFAMVFKSQRRMIVNPYPYQGEAYKSWP